MLPAPPSTLPQPPLAPPPPPEASESALPVDVPVGDCSLSDQSLLEVAGLSPTVRRFAAYVLPPEVTTSPAS